MKCYHTTTRDRIPAILTEGLKTNSPPNFFTEPAPYIMLSLLPWHGLHGEESVVLEVTDPEIHPECFQDAEGLRWPRDIAPRNVRVMRQHFEINLPVSLSASLHVYCDIWPKQRDIETLIGMLEIAAKSCARKEGDAEPEDTP